MLVIQADLENYGNENGFSFSTNTVDAVIHLAGESHQSKMDKFLRKKKNFSSRTETTNQLLQCFKIAKGIPQLFFALGHWFYGDRKKNFDRVQFKQVLISQWSLSKWKSSFLSFRILFWTHTLVSSPTFGVILDPKTGAFSCHDQTLLLKSDSPWFPTHGWMSRFRFLQGHSVLLGKSKDSGPSTFVSQTLFNKMILQNSLPSLEPSAPNVPIPSFCCKSFLKVSIDPGLPKGDTKVLKDHGFEWEITNSYKTPCWTSQFLYFQPKITTVNRAWFQIQAEMNQLDCGFCSRFWNICIRAKLLNGLFPHPKNYDATSTNKTG